MISPLYFAFELLRADYVHWPFAQMIWPVAPVLQATQATLKLTDSIDSVGQPDFTNGVQAASSVTALALFFMSVEHWTLAPVVDMAGQLIDLSFYWGQYGSIS